MPYLKRLVEGQVGPVIFAEIAEALATVDVSGRDPEWRADWAELIATVKRAIHEPANVTRFATADYGPAGIAKGPAKAGP
ncbi:MAG: hypothetical protein ACJ8DH_02340, partial [Microvirga sp.]